MSLHPLVTHREALKAVINKIVDDTSVDDLLEMLIDIADEKAGAIMRKDSDHAAAAKWLLIERALRRGALVINAGEL